MGGNKDREIPVVRTVVLQARIEITFDTEGFYFLDTTEEKIKALAEMQEPDLIQAAVEGGEFTDLEWGIIYDSGLILEVKE